MPLEQGWPDVLKMEIPGGFVKALICNTSLWLCLRLLKKGCINSEILSRDELINFITNHLLILGCVEFLPNGKPAPNHISAQIGEAIAYRTIWQFYGTNKKVCAGTVVALKREAASFI